jgi:thiamine biosynthesis protein ThiS
LIKVDKKEVAWQEGMTVSDLLALLGETYDYAVVRVNDQVVSRPHFDKTPVPDGAQVYLIPMVAGG